MLHVFLPGCNESIDPSSSYNGDNSLSPSGDMAVNTVSYPINPYEKDGIKHNKMMYEFYEKIKNDNIQLVDYFQDKNGYYDQLKSQFCEINDASNIYPNITCNDWYNDVVNNPVLFLLSDNLSELFDISNTSTVFYKKYLEYMDTKLIPNASENDSYWLGQMRDLLYSYCKSNMEFSAPLTEFPSYSSETLLDNILLIEEGMLNFQWDSNDYLAFKYLAIFKYTTNLWYEYSQQFYLAPKTNKNNDNILVAGDGYDGFRRDMKYLMFVGWLIVGDAIGNAVGTGYAFSIWTAAEVSGFVDSYIEDLVEMHKKQFGSGDGK